jgi:hypothetical protein
MTSPSCAGPTRRAPRWPASFARILDDPDDGGRWLAAIAARAGAAAFADLEIVAAIAAARQQRPLLGAVELLDEMTALLDAPNLCRRWGEAAVRLANLERLRARAVEYARRCRAEGVGCTAAGMLTELESGPGDRRRRGSGASEPAATSGAMHVSTWHGAKGLEWPITVLYELDAPERAMAALGVHVETDRASIDLAAPLAGRWIRYWPWPYGAQRSNLSMLERLATTAEARAAAERSDREELRLLYVGWTRARDRVILATRGGSLSGGTLAPLRLAGADPEHLALAAVAAASGAGAAPAMLTWSGRMVEVALRAAAPAAPVARCITPEPTWEPRRPRPHPPAFVSPSDISAAGPVGEPIRLGERIAVNLSPAPDWTNLGSAVHGFLAADHPELKADAARRRAIAQRLLAAWRVESAIAADDLLEASERLRRWIDRQWPGATWHRELPLAARGVMVHSATITRGIADLVLETPGGALVVIDHKSFPGTVDQAPREAAAYAGQLAAYAAAAGAAFGRPVAAQFIHLPLAAMAVPVHAAAAAALTVGVDGDLRTG